MSASKAKGTRWEAAVCDFLKPSAPHVERRALAGTRDRGDIAGIPGVVIECKNAAKLELAQWLDEATTEAANDHADLGVVWAHRRGKASPADGYVVMDGRSFIWLLRSAGYLKPEAEA